MIILATWLLWKAGNACVFDAEQPTIARVFNNIREEAKSWAAAAGAPGLDTSLGLSGGYVCHPLPCNSRHVFALVV